MTLDNVRREHPMDRELILHRRYSALMRRGWREVIWCESGTYYLACDAFKPDWKSKRLLGLDQMEHLLTQAEAEIGPLRKPIGSTALLSAEEMARVA